MFSLSPQERLQAEMTYPHYAYFPYPYQPDVTERIEVRVVARQVRYRWVPDEQGAWGWQPVPLEDPEQAPTMARSAEEMATSMAPRPIRTIYVTNHASNDAVDEPEYHNEAGGYMVDSTLTEFGS